MPFVLSAFPVARGASEIALEDSFLYPRSTGVHHGIDISGEPGLSIICPLLGQVVRTCKLGGNRVSGTGTSPKGGNYAVIVDLYRNFHYFAHMQKPASVAPGMWVTPLQVIGALGDTGIARGRPHLHYQVWGPFTHNGADQEYANLEFVYRFSGPINPYAELVRLANLMGARHNPGGRYFIPPITRR